MGDQAEYNHKGDNSGASTGSRHPKVANQDDPLKDLTHSQIFYMLYPRLWWITRILAIVFSISIFIIILMLLLSGENLSLAQRSIFSGAMLLMLFLVGVYFVSIHGKPGTVRSEYSDLDNL